MKKESVKPFVGGIVVGALVLLIVIFSTGWAVTSSSADKKAEEMVEDAVIDRLASIGIAQFHQDPDRETQLNELKETDSWKRGDYVEETGWATMPGDESPDPKVADEVARQLMSLD